MLTHQLHKMLFVYYCIDTAVTIYMKIFEDIYFVEVKSEVFLQFGFADLTSLFP